MPKFSADELDLIEQVLQDREMAFTHAGKHGEDDTGFVVDDCDISVRQFKKMASRILQKMHGAEDMPPIQCPDCGEEGEVRGHYGCQYPTDDPNIEGLEDPMMTER